MINIGSNSSLQGLTVVILVAAGIFAAPVQATPCVRPEAAVATRDTVYVDAQTGNDAGDGSAAHPWKSLARALPKGGTTPGKTILLGDGNYGDLHIAGQDNSRFVTIAAAPGRHPVLAGLHIERSGEWMLRGLTFHSRLENLDRSHAGFLVDVRWGAHDIILTHLIVEGQPDPGWSQQDWLDHIPGGVMIVGDPQYARCVTLDNTVIRNVTTGILVQRTANATIVHNTVDRYGHDGIDFGASDLTISANRVVNRVDLGDALTVHPDIFQGQPYHVLRPDVEHYRNILISDNVAILEEEPNIPFADKHAPMYNVQGISEFDGDWDNLKIINNVIVTRSYHGIVVFAAHNSLISNNTLLYDGGGDPRLVPWIGIFPAKAVYGSTPSSGITIRGNVADSLLVMPGTTDARIQHNVFLAALGAHSPINWPENGALHAIRTPGSYGDGNVVSAAPMDKVFRAFVPRAHRFDLRPIPGSPATAAGADPAILQSAGAH